MGCNIYSNFGEIILCVSENYFVHICIYEGKGFYMMVVRCAIWICFCGSTWTPMISSNFGEIILCVLDFLLCIWGLGNYMMVVVVCSIWICFCGSTWTPIMGNDGQRRTGSEIKWKPRSEIYQDIRDISRYMIWDLRYGWTELGH